MSTFNSLLRKATSLLKIGSLDSSPHRVPLDGEITFCKNNVCVHPPVCQRTDVTHHPGYLTIRQQVDEVLGSTLILTWIPNATLQKNSRTLENRTPGGSPCPTPTRSPFRGSVSAANLTYGGNEEARNGSAPESSPTEEEEGDRKSFSSTLSDMGSSPRGEFGSLDSFSDPHPRAQGTDVRKAPSPPNNGGLQSQSDSGIGPEDISAALEHRIGGLNVSKQDSVCTHVTNSESHETDGKASHTDECTSNTSYQEMTDCIQTPSQLDSETNDSVPETPNIDVSPSSPAPSSSATPTTSNRDPESFPSSPDSTPPLSPREKMASLLGGTAESLAHAHNLSFPEHPHSAVSRRESSCGVFSVDLSQMRSLRLFYSNKECNCGQLVIASRESQYKILHFHHGGLDKLAKVFEEYNFLSKSKNKVGGEWPCRQFCVCRPELSASECHPEEGAYGTVDEQRWRSFTSADGQIEDELQLRKEIFFGGLEPKLHAEVWPFLLHFYKFRSTFEEREQIRNDKYIEYQNIRRKRDQMSVAEQDVFWRTIQCTVEKDVVRTDRSHPFFAGEDNPNIEIMKNILLNYGFYNPKIGYTQGMSDLLAPILATVQNESEAFWCFVGLMQKTIFVTCPKDFDMDINLNYLRELFRIMNHRFYLHLCASDALDLLFVHRWILLCFKREFPEAEAMRLWEACWSHYQTDYFHLFVCSAIVAVYGGDVVAQGLRADEMMVHFSSLAMHMSGEIVLRKARGVLHQFRLLPRIPCSLSRLCELCGPGMWDSGHVPLIDCTGEHGGDRACPHGGQDPSMKIV